MEPISNKIRKVFKVIEGGIMFVKEDIISDINELSTDAGEFLGSVLSKPSTSNDKIAANEYMKTDIITFTEADDFLNTVLAKPSTSTRLTRNMATTMKRRSEDNSDVTENNKKPKLAGTCIICTENLNFVNPTPEKEVMSTQCGHLFCKSCIVPALKKYKACPKCIRKQTPRNLHPLYL